MNTETQPETTADDSQNVQAPSKPTKPKPAEPNKPRTAARLALNNLRYWEGRLYRESYVRGGQKFLVPEWYCKLNHAGQRRAFNLGSANKTVAAEKAREIWQHLVRHGWPATLQKYAPTATDTNHAPTLGQFLAEVQRTAGLKPRTFHRYSMYLRGIIAHIMGITDKDGRRYDYRSGGRTAWIAKLDNTPLSKLTPEAAADWKADYLARAGDDPVRQVCTRRAFNAALRSAKSLFSSRIIHADNFRVQVPNFKITDPQHGEREVYWFANLGFEKPGSMKFRPPEGITYQSLILDARKELREAHPESYLLFLLCLCGGLRRGEADVLTWDQIHYGNAAEDCYIAIETNQFIQPKHGSSGLVYVEPELLKEVLTFKDKATESFVVNSPMKWKRTVHFRYRCEPHWKVLNDWLAGKGITDRKKIHTLRKMFGDAIVKAQGIYAAAAQLRHTGLQVTVKHYSDPRQRAPLPVANLLTDKPLKPLLDNAADEILERIGKMSPDDIARVFAAVKKVASKREPHTVQTAPQSPTPPAIAVDSKAAPS